MDQQNHISYWLGTTPGTSYRSLEGNIQVDVAIIGGGMAGLNAGMLLAESGKKVA